MKQVLIGLAMFTALPLAFLPLLAENSTAEQLVGLVMMGAGSLVSFLGYFQAIGLIERTKERNDRAALGMASMASLSRSVPVIQAGGLSFSDSQRMEESLDNEDLLSA